MSPPQDFFNQDPTATSRIQPVKPAAIPAPASKSSLRAMDSITDNVPIKAANQRQRRITWGMFWGSNLLILAACGLGFYLLSQKFQGQMKNYSARADASSKDDISQQLSLQRYNENLKDNLQQSDQQIKALQDQLDAQAKEREATQARLQEMADRLALVIKQNTFVPSADVPRLSNADASQVAALLPTVTPATSELILLKERNRLTDYADKAIATGQRQAMQAIVDSMIDPALKHLHHAALAEFRRVQSYYEISLSIDPGYTLPLDTLFKDKSIKAEADLTPKQLTQLLQNPSNPWEVRLRSAYLLRSSSETETNPVLIRAIKEDPSLDVAKQAQTTFEKRVNRRFRLFDIPAIDAWWEVQQKK
jgi:hypothetical protein